MSIGYNQSFVNNNEASQWPIWKLLFFGNKTTKIAISTMNSDNLRKILQPI